MISSRIGAVRCHRPCFTEAAQSSAVARITRSFMVDLQGVSRPTGFTMALKATILHVKKGL